MANRKFPQCLVWIDLETTGLDPREDRVLEVAAIMTDFDLNKMGGYSAVIKLDKAGATRLRANEYVLNMHKENGLLAETRGAEAVTLAQAEKDLIQMLKEDSTFVEGEFMLAGSGVANFDMQVLRAQMPEFEKYFAYYSLDIGVVRRAVNILGGNRMFVNPTKASYGDAKLHRALNDVEAHLEEAGKYKHWLRNLPNE